MAVEVLEVERRKRLEAHSFPWHACAGTSATTPARSAAQLRPRAADRQAPSSSGWPPPPGPEPAILHEHGGLYLKARYIICETVERRMKLHLPEDPRSAAHSVITCGDVWVLTIQRHNLLETF